MSVWGVFSIMALLAIGDASRIETDGTMDVEAAFENLQADEQALAEDLDEEIDSPGDEGEEPYWYKNKGTWEFVAPNLQNNEYVQQFEMKEGYNFVNKYYRVKLDELEDPSSGKEVRKNINAEVMKLENYFFTMYRHQSAVFKDTDGVQIGEYLMFKPQLLNRHYTWRVAKMNEPDKILFTIQKRLWNDHCKYVNLFSCRPVLKIYVGHRGDKSTLIYYGVGDKDLDEPDFKFYHSVAEYKQAKHKWVGKVDHKKTKGALEKDTYKVKVTPNEDAGLILLAAVCLDKVGDDARAAEDD
jgi:hypothetical protein